MKINSFINKYVIVCFIVVVCIAIFLRFQGVFTNSFPFTYDIGRDFIAAQEIATLQKVPLIGHTTGLPGLFYGPSWYYILALLYHPLQGDPTLFTGFINATGVAMTIAAFFLGRRIGGNILGLTWAGLLAVSPSVIALTSQVWNPNLIPIFWIASYICLYFIFKGKKPLINFFTLGILVALIVDMEIVVGLLYVVGITCTLLITRPSIISIKKVGIGILGFLLITFPRIVFDFRHENVLSKTLLGGLRDMFIKGGEEAAATPTLQKFSTLFAVWADSLTLGSRFFGMLLLVGLVILTVVFYRTADKTLRFFLTLTMLSLAISCIGLLFFGHAIWEHYLVMLPLLYITWIALVGAIVFAKKYQILVLAVVGLIFTMNLNVVKQYKALTTPLWEGDAAVYRNQLQVVDYAYNESNGKPFKFIVYTPPVHDYTYRYLFNWYGEKIYGRVPDDSSRLLFVILEPDHEQPQRLKDWLLIRENDGKVVKEKEVSAGIIVQTRITK